MTYTRYRAVILFPIILILLGLACSLSPDSDDSSTSSSSTENDSSTSLATFPSNRVSERESTSIPSNFQGDLELERVLINLYEQVNPSVVHILVYLSDDQSRPLTSGSGFIYDSDGKIITNNHVVQDGQVFEVVFSNGNRRIAEIVGRDVDSDLAVIEVDSLPEGSVPVALGDSDDLRVGQLVIAIGNPFGEQGSMSMGIISGLGRSLESQRQVDLSGGFYSLPEVVQTDAPINPGNSGGPLINLSGEVVGVNSAIRTTTGLNSGVGFSIPVNAVTLIVPELIENGIYEYAYMGVQIQSLNLSLQDSLDLPRFSGAYVTGVTEDSPAADAGLVPANVRDGTGGDLIVAIDGHEIRDTDALIAYLVFNTRIEQTIELSILRDGESVLVPLTLGQRP